MNRTTNWGYGPDYSNQNWTGRVPRVGSWNTATGSYAHGSERIPRFAWACVAAVGMTFFAVVAIGAAVGF